MPPAGAVPAIPYAAWPQRFLAWLIDNGPVFVVIIILEAALGNGGNILGDLIALGWFIYNYGIQQGTTGYTLGKGIIGIKTINESTGQPVGTGMAIVRGITHILDTLACFIGWFWPLWDDKRQTFADKILTQVVIVAPKS
ncbi:MAG: hypothetical protein JWR52_1805 [Marmoricola sp.]|nr:hypothetical protein [Marmoricola sp.]